ncbi:MAG: hypothetical protein PHQ42_03940, partial [Patescibacteria group bacterium]|nr:hypothetical protein [Patescibacteria group bacterium]
YKITAADDGGNETALADSTALRVCSTKTISNGTVSSACAITCNSGYTQNGYTCVSSGGPSSSFLQGETITSEEELEEEAETPSTTEKLVEKTQEAVEEITDTAKQAAQAFAEKITAIVSEAAEIVKANVNSLLGKLGFKRDLVKEKASVEKYVKSLIKDMPGYGQEQRNALNNFIAYGTDTTLKLGEGERAGVVNSYKSAFGKLPATETEWSDAIKIANGRWPSETNEQTEGNAEAAFKKIYLRNPDRTNPHDDAAVTVMAYGLRPANRNLDSEKAAIRIFRAIYGYSPKNASAWDIVRAIAYSGATR